MQARFKEKTVVGLFGPNVSKRQTWSTALVFALASLVASAPVSAAPKAKGKIPEVSDIAFDPSAVRGELPNGMKYIVLPNAKPEKALSIRLYIASGSYDETDAERGAAQALAQLALDETQHFPGGTLKKAFDAEGIEFGSLRNANANINGTTYSIELKDVNRSKLDLSLKWLGDVANGLSIQNKSLDQAKSALSEQYQLNLGGPKEISDVINRFVAPNLKISKRDPIATPQEINALKADSVQRYYTKWYRPQNAYLVIVGDANMDEIFSSIQTYFGTWNAPPPPVRESAKTRLSTRGLEVMTRTLSVTHPLIMVCKTRPAIKAEADSIKSRVAMINQFGWLSILNHRLGRIGDSANSPFLLVRTQVNRDREIDVMCLEAIPLNNQWQFALGTLATELQRLERHGVFLSELQELKNNEIADFTKLEAGEKDRVTPDLADEFIRAIASKAVSPSPAEAKRVAELVWASATPDTIMQGFRSSWNGSGPLVSLISQTPVDPSELKQQWTAAMAAQDPGIPSIPGKVVWPYSDFGPKGEVISRETISPPGFTRVTFRNGVILNLKQLNYENEYAWIRVRFGAGHRQIDPKQRPALILAPLMLVPGGLGQLSLDEVRQVNRDKQWGLLLSIGRDSFNIQGDTRLSDLDREMETITAFLADPGFRAEADVRVQGAVERLFQGVDTPVGKAMLALADLYGTNSLIGLPSREELLATKMSDIAALLKTPMQTEGLEVTLVSDLKDNNVIDLIARTLGALPERKKSLTIRSDFKPLAYGPGQTIRVDLNGSSEKSAISVIWPTFVLENSRRIETRSVVLMTEILKKRLKARLADEKLQGVDVIAIPQFPNRFDQGSINLSLLAPTGELERVQKILRETVARFGSHKVTVSELKATQKPILDSSKSRRDNSGWWSNIMDGSARDPSLIEVDLSIESDIRRLKPRDITDSAAKWLKPENMIEVIVAPKQAPNMPESTSAPASSPTP